MKGEISQDVVVEVPASAVWAAYRGLELGKLGNKLLSDVIGTAEPVEGDGGVGTILKLTFPPGTPGLGYLKERFVRMDDDLRVKETEVLEGGFKEFGFDSVRIRLEIIEKDDESTVIRNTLVYEVDDAKADLIISHLTTKQLEVIAETVGKYLIDQKSKA